MTTQPTQLAKLAAPFPRRLGDVEIIKQRETTRGQTESYVAHGVVNQWLLGVCGAFDFEVVEVIRGDVAAIAPNPKGKSDRAKAGTPALSGVVVGALCRLTVEVDGRRTVVTEVGDVDDVHNWRHDGERAKQAASDGLKRAAMRLGLGLHLWSGESYILDQRLNGNGSGAPAG